MINSTHLDFPMEQYVSAWKLFRFLSDENIETAKHLISLPNWKHPKRILDVGCGDGLLLKSLILLEDTLIDEVVLLDPDKDLLDTAYHNIIETSIIPQVSTIHKEINNSIPECFNDIEAILGIHIAYLIDANLFKQFLLNLPHKVPFYLVLDDLDSIFSTLWQNTAPKYYDRSKMTNELMEVISSENFIVNKTFINSHIKNPLNFNRNVKEKLLSILCYTDFQKLSQAKKEVVESTIKKFLKNDNITCTSVCYEIIRK